MAVFLVYVVVRDAALLREGVWLVLGVWGVWGGGGFFWGGGVGGWGGLVIAGVCVCFWGWILLVLCFFDLVVFFFLLCCGLGLRVGCFGGRPATVVALFKIFFSRESTGYGWWRLWVVEA